MKLSFFDIVRYIKSLFSLATGKSKLASKSDTACLVVGMERSKKFGSCPGANHDSNEMGKVLAKYGRTTLLQDGMATTGSIRSALTEAVKRDLAIFYYSGHGGKSGDSEFLCPSDGKFWDREIWDIVSNARGRVVLIFDCCHSGHMYRDAVQMGEGPDEAYGGFEFRMLREMPMAAGSHDILVWSGCPKDSYSYGDSSGGVFTNGLLKGIGKTAATYDTVWKAGQKAAASQNPVRTVMGSGFGGLVFR